MNTATEAIAHGTADGEDSGAQAWADAQLVAALLSMDPAGLGGVRLRSWATAPRRLWLAQFQALLPDAAAQVTVPIGVDEGQLLGSVDLAALTRSRKLELSGGLLTRAHGGVQIVRMAERLPVTHEALLCRALDEGQLRVEREGLSAIVPARFGCVALDEGILGEEGLGASLADRLAFTVDLHHVSAAGCAAAGATFERAGLQAAAARLPRVSVAPALLPALCKVALKLHVPGLRAPFFAQRVARAIAALQDSTVVNEAHAQRAVQLVYGPRARAVAPPEPAPEPAPPDGSAEASTPPEAADQVPPEPSQPPPADGDGAEDLLAEQLLAAAQAALPANLLDRAAWQRRRRQGEGASSRFGPPRESRRRGAPLSSRPGALGNGARLDVPATLRRAAPWQPLRRDAQQSADNVRPLLTPDDVCLRRFRQHAPTITLFLVDASGSAARARLAEAKGAVEELLGECYVRRDEVALIAFRGNSAEMLLPPTRSLVRAKRTLAGLAGGGGTPLASGLRAALLQVLQLSRRGLVPVLVLITDGRPNVDLEGQGGRAQAAEDARQLARALALTDCAALVVDSSPRGQPFLVELAQLLDAEYLPLPHSRDVSLGQQVAAIGRGVSASASAPR